MRERGIILTEGVVLGLFFVQRYRFLTIDQFARAAGMHRDTASRQLRSLELRGVLSHFGRRGHRVSDPVRPGQRYPSRLFRKASSGFHIRC